MPDPLDPLSELTAAPTPKPRSPRERVHSIAAKSSISPDIADDYYKLTHVESGHNVNVRDSSKGAQGFGQVMPDVKGGSTRTVGGRKYNLRDPDQNIEAGLRYFNEGGSDPVGRRLYYFGGPGARARYQRTGKIPNISDGNMTAAQYVKATGASFNPQARVQQDPLSELTGGSGGSTTRPPPTTDPLTVATTSLPNKPRAPLPPVSTARPTGRQSGAAATSGVRGVNQRPTTNLLDLPATMSLGGRDIPTRVDAPSDPITPLPARTRNQPVFSTSMPMYQDRVVRMKRRVGGAGELRQLDDPATAQINRIQQQVTAAQTPAERAMQRAPGTTDTRLLAPKLTENEEVLRRVGEEQAGEAIGRDAQIERERLARQFTDADRAEIADFARHLQGKGRVYSGARTGIRRGGSSALYKLAGVAEVALGNFGPFKTESSGWIPDYLRKKALAGEMSVDDIPVERRNQLAEFLAETGVGLAELGAAPGGIATKFAGMAGAESLGRNQPASEVARETAKGAAMAGAQKLGESFAPAGAGYARRVAASAPAVGLASGAVELATGGTPREAAMSALTNAAFQTIGERGRRVAADAPLAEPIPASRRGALINEQANLARETPTTVPDIDATLAAREQGVKPTLLRDDSGLPVGEVLNPDEVAQGGKPRVRYLHRELGDVVTSDNQRRVGKGRTRVVLPDGSTTKVVAASDLLPPDAHYSNLQTRNDAGQFDGPVVRPTTAPTELDPLVEATRPTTPTTTPLPRDGIENYRPVTDAMESDPVVAHNRAQLTGDTFNQALLKESVGGNAGRDRAAVNMLVDSEGRIQAIGNFQELPEMTQRARAAGRLRDVTVTVKYEDGVPRVEKVHGPEGVRKQVEDAVGQWATSEPSAPPASRAALPPDTIQQEVILQDGRAYNRIDGEWYLGYGDMKVPAPREVVGRLESLTLRPPSTTSPHEQFIEPESQPTTTDVQPQNGPAIESAQWQVERPATRLSPKEQEWYDWAESGAKDVLGDEAWLHDNPDAATRHGQLDDLRQRLEDQAPDLIREGEGAGSGALRSLLRKLESAKFFDEQESLSRPLQKGDTPNDPLVSRQSATPESLAKQPEIESVATPRDATTSSTLVGGREVVPPAGGSKDRVPLPDTTSTKNAATKQLREDLELSEVDAPERKSFQQSIDNALAKGLDKQAESLAKDVMEGRKDSLSNDEAAGVQHRMRELENEYEGLYASEPTSPRLQAIEDSLDTLTRATRIAGTATARDLSFRRSTIDRDFKLVNLVRKLRADQDAPLTPRQREQVEQHASKYAELESKLAAANEQLAQQRLQKAITKETRRGRRSVNRATLDDEFASLKSNFAAELAKVKGVQASGFAGLDPEGKLTKLVARMASNRIRAGTTDAAQLIDDIHTAISEHADVSRRQVAEALSGYGRPVAEDKRTTTQRRLAEIKRELSGQLAEADVAAGTRSARKEGPRLDEKGVGRREGPHLGDVRKVPAHGPARRLFSRDAARQRALLREQARLENEMTTGRLTSTPDREPPQYTRETYRIQKELEKTRADYEKMRYDATTSRGQKLLDTAVGVANVPKTMLTIGDLSAVLRQGGIGVGQHPVLSIRAARDMVESFSRHGFANVESKIADSPYFEIAKKSGLELTGQNDSRLSHREEGYLGGNVVDALARGRYNIPGKTLKEVKDFSERTFVSFLDSQRMRIFEHQARQLENMHLTPPELKEALKSQAKYINIITGRGNLGVQGNKASPILNIAGFSPRLVASRFQFLNKMFNPVAWARMPKGARALQMTDNINYLVAAAATLALAKRAGGADINLNDEDDADFLKIRVGDTKFDTLSGLQQPMRFLLRMAKAIRGGETYSGDSKGKIAADFLRSKASPEAGLAVDYMEGKNRLSGKKFEPLADTLNTLYPLPIQDFMQAIEEDGALKGTVEALPSLFGVGVQSYKGAAEKATTPAEKLARRRGYHGGDDEGRTQEEIDRDATKAQLRARSRRGEDVSGEIAALGAKLTERQVKGILAARGKTRLQEDFNRLGIKDAALVYSVATSAQQAELRDLLQRKSALIDMLPPDEQDAVRQRLQSFGMTSGPLLREPRKEREERKPRALRLGYTFPQGARP